jgi:hypothetical protein
MVMKKFTLALVLFTFGFVAIVEAQLREDINRSSDYTGAIFKTEQSQNNTLGNLMSSINMTMSHSYSMNFGSVGGEFQNLNAYTNHMSFDFSENLTGHVDLSVLHSPFGNSFMNMGNNSLGARVMIDRAQLDYQISPNSSLSIQFSQRPYYYSPYGMGRGMYGSRNQYWY